jgi:phosphatidate cytidylyltransferase
VLQWRLITGTGLAVALVALVWLDWYLAQDDVLGMRAIALGPLAVILAALAAAELSQFWKGRPWQPATWIAAAGATVVVLANFVSLWSAPSSPACLGQAGWSMFGCAAAIGLAFGHELIAYRQPGHSSQRLALTVLVIVYVGGLISFLAVLRGWGDNATGIVALLSVLVPVKLSDSSAYTMGRLVGTTRLAPAISPGKTIEGLMGGLVGGVLGAVLVLCVIGPWLVGQSRGPSIGIAVVFGLAVTLAGVFGDLAESLLKRDCGQKDSGQWVPGMGGVMDVLDSVLAAAPVAAAFWVCGTLESA